MKKWLKYLGFSLLAIGVLFVMSVYIGLIEAGRSTYQIKNKQVNVLVGNYPDFFKTTYTDIFDFALGCEQSREECTRQTRSKFDSLSLSTQVNEKAKEQMAAIPDNHPPVYVPSNRQPIYFIKLLPNGKIAKLFFSGDLVIEEVNTREEKMVREMLQGKRTELYGPYFNAEVYSKGESPGHPFFDPKPAYLKDLYAQMEVIVPYYQDGELTGAIVYLHGQ